MIEGNKKELEEKLFKLIENYYILIGLQLDPSLSLSELRVLGQNLPPFQESAFSSSELIKKLLKLESERTQNKLQLSDIEQKIKELEDLNDYAGEYSSRLNFIDRTLQTTQVHEGIVCPLCHNSVTSIEETLNEILESREKLKEDIKKTSTYKVDNSDQIELLRRDRDKLKTSIREVSAKIAHLQEQNDEYKKNRALRDQVMVAKGIVETTVKQILDENSYAGERIEISELEDEIRTLKSRIDGYGLKPRREQASAFLSNKMNTICGELDFEEELKPPNFYFDIENFDFYHQHNNGKIHLSQMGSGANWLACHLSLFLSLLWLATREKGCSIPTVLFLDQPSQVYFPKGAEDTTEGTSEYEENIKQVQNIFDVLVKVLSDIQSECSFLPQLVVMEHADRLVLKYGNFDSFVRKRWSKNGEKLI